MAACESKAQLTSDICGSRGGRRFLVYTCEAMTEMKERMEESDNISH